MRTGIVFLASLLPVFPPSLSLSFSCSEVEVNTYCRCSNNSPSLSLALRRSQPVSRIFPLFPTTQLDPARAPSLFSIRVPSFPLSVQTVLHLLSFFQNLSSFCLYGDSKLNNTFLNKFLILTFLQYYLLRFYRC